MVDFEVLGVSRGTVPPEGDRHVTEVTVLAGGQQSVRSMGEVMSRIEYGNEFLLRDAQGNPKPIRLYKCPCGYTSITTEDNDDDQSLPSS